MTYALKPPGTVLLVALLAAATAFAETPAPGEDHGLDQQLQTIAAAHHGKVGLYAQNLRTGATASLAPDVPVKTASVIKMGILLDAAEQIRNGQATLDEKLVLTKPNQVAGSGVLGQLDTPLALTLRDTLTLMAPPGCRPYCWPTTATWLPGASTGWPLAA